MFKRKVLNYFEIAGRVAIKKVDQRTFLLGAVGIRNDGAFVQSMNGASKVPTPPAHAEARLCRKLDVGSVVYVARVRVGDGQFAMAKPCGNCQKAMRAAGVKKVYYTISSNEYGCITF